jgi:lysine-ketoglutarate reductase/saccharopine dehydrogenase-like protein (TIGR00300 family)
MPFHLPTYTSPDFSAPDLAGAPLVTFKEADTDGVLPEGFHATSVFPEYLHLKQGEWLILPDSRMDCAVVLAADGSLQVREPRTVKSGDAVACGRGENGEDGIYVHTRGFDCPGEAPEKFAFRGRLSRESPFSIDYDELYDLLRYERRHGFILWVLGPAVIFDRDSRKALISLIRAGYVHGVTAGNGFAAHDLEGSLYGTALGQDIYTKRQAPAGHYHHLDTINAIRQAGSISGAAASGLIRDGVMHELIRRDVPFVLAGSIRDDGPLPEVEANITLAQDRMRDLARRATTVIALATQLHAIAVGNMVPSYRFNAAEEVRPVYFYTVDMSEFVVTKLANRGSLTARSILTNAQDFVVILNSGLQRA